MTAIAVCTDSSSLLPPAAALALDVDVVPVPIAVDGREVRPPGPAPDDFYELIERGAVASTSLPGPGDFARAYSRAAARGAREVLSIHLDGRASGVTAAAELARRDARLPVSVVDASTSSYGVAVSVRESVRVLEAGGSATDAGEAARSVGASMRNAFVAPRASGRITGAGWDVLRYDAGAVERLAPCDSAAEAIDAMARLVLSEERTVSVAVGHAARAVEPAADDLAHRLVGQPGIAALERYRIGPAVGAHTGPSSFGLFWWPTR